MKSLDAKSQSRKEHLEFQDEGTLRPSFSFASSFVDLVS
jgi:hypothetical protein